ELTARLRALACRPNLREQLSQTAAAWIREQNEISRSAARYLQFAESLIAQRAKPRKRSATQLEFKTAGTIRFDHAEALAYVKAFFANAPNASDYIRVHGPRLLRTVELLPQGAPEQRVLELSSYLHLPLLVRHYGHYGEIAVTNWWPGET